MYILLVLVCFMRDLSVFIKIASYGVISCVALTVMILGFGISGLANNTFHVDVVPMPPG